MPIVEKACKRCGHIEAMGESCELCLACRIQKHKERANIHRRKYYEKHRQEILAKMKAKRSANKTYLVQVFSNPIKKRSKWTVEFINTDGSYSWRAWFRSEETGRLVKFESARNFKNILLAKKDYDEATR